MQNTFKKLLTSDREATFFRAIWLQLPLISLVMSCWVRCVSHTQQFYHQADSKHALTVRESLCVDSLQCYTKPIPTYKLLPVALVSHFSLDWTDTISAVWHSVCGISGHSEPQQLQVPLGTCTIWCFWISAYIPFYYWKTKVSGHASDLLEVKLTDSYGLWCAEGRDADIGTSSDVVFCKIDELHYDQRFSMEVSNVAVWCFSGIICGGRKMYNLCLVTCDAGRALLLPVVRPLSHFAFNHFLSHSELLPVLLVTLMARNDTQLPIWDLASSSVPPQRR